MRTLLLIIAIGIGYLIIKHLAKGKKISSRPTQSNTKMVKCEHCGLHIPEAEAVTSAGHFFCSEEHRHLHKSSS